jgi:hypothetical protein
VFTKRDNRSRLFLGLVPIVVASLLIVGVLVCQPVSSCYGPHITATISATEINIYENVTVTGTVCMGTEEEPTNLSVRVTFVRPDYSWIEQFIEADHETGEFTVTQQLARWNVFPILGHINDGLDVTVNDPDYYPFNPPPVVRSPFKPNLLLIAGARARTCLRTLTRSSINSFT